MNRPAVAARGPGWRALAVVGALSALAAAAAGRLVVPGAAASLPLTSGSLTVIAAPAPGDLAPPRLTALEMFDDDADGRVDRVLATFDEPLASPYTAGTTGWTLAAVPSGGSLASVSVSATTATLTLTEGPDAADTVVGAFTVALEQTAGGVRDAGDRLAAFGPTAPADRAGPVPVWVGTLAAGAKAGQMESGDGFGVGFSERVAPASLPVTTTVTENDAPGNGDRSDHVDIPGITSGRLPAGSESYVTRNEATSVAVATVGLAYDDRLVTVTLGACVCGEAKAGQGAFTYVPAPTIADPAGNGARGTFTTASGFRLF